MSDSPVIRTRPVLEQPTSESEEEENDETDDSTQEVEEEDTDENEDEKNQNEQKIMQMKTVASKPAISSVPAAITVVASTSQHPKYDKMVKEAVLELGENKRNGTSIQMIIKFIANKYTIPDSKAKIFCKKAIEKGLKDEMYVKTTGVGFNGSINFSTTYKKLMKREQAKLAKPTKPKPEKVITAVKPKPKKVITAAKPKPKKSSTKPKKDSNNNPATKVGSKSTKTANTKAKISKNGKVRLSINTKAIPQPKLKATVKPKSAGASGSKKATTKVAVGKTSETKTISSKTKPQPKTTNVAKAKSK